MRVGVCFSIFLLCAALAHAAPASKATEKKSLAEDTKFESKKEDLKIDETGEDKDRTKKSAATFCVEIQPGSSQPTQVSCKDNQVAAQNTPLTIQTDTISQPIQAVSVVQPFMQTIPQPNIVVPQYIPQPFQTVQIVQPPQPCVQSTPSINVVQSVPQSNVIHTSKPKPKPTPASTVEIETTPEPPKPACIEQLPQPLPEPQESFAVLPVAPAFHKNFITIPSSSMVMVPEVEQAQLATIVQVPSVSPCSNPLHGILSPCTCQKNVAVMSDSNVEPMTMKVLPLAPYSSSFASSPYPLVMPYDSKMLPQILTNVSKKNFTIMALCSVTLTWVAHDVFFFAGSSGKTRTSRKK
ncbi:hypothetical protein WN55_02990 [Dufourea novaeangliae]|uniref:Uncharacterized protein n=1 Tax=Dufourea novaeangliae TaxID=178035 RepID=A0A154PHR9_DUFNO|nr:hypothetical protein WN55_02990 [Dufourea novaeangliae]